MDIYPIKAFDDNYIWLIRHNGLACVVDPGDEEPVLEFMQGEALELNAIMITHKHGDHCGGVRALLERFPSVAVYGPANERVSGLTRPVGEGDSVNLPEMGLKFQVMELPGHTEGHLAYYRPGVLFCGDTMFSVGCGRVFSGTHAQLYQSLRRIAQLPADTLCYCAHEYTLDNIGFAKWVEPENTGLQAYELEVRALQAENRPSVPSRLSLELACNPFLRTDQSRVIQAVESYAGHKLASAEAVFTTLRDWKDKEYD